MTKKRNDPYEQQEWQRNQRYFSTSTLKEQHPDVIELRVQMSFKPHDAVGLGKPADDEKSFYPESKAFFEVKCPFRECIDGGFDLSFVVRQLVEDHSPEKSGSVECQGWQDLERRGKNKCLLRMDYKIAAKYG